MRNVGERVGQEGTKRGDKEVVQGRQDRRGQRKKDRDDDVDRDRDSDKFK